MSNRGRHKSKRNNDSWIFDCLTLTEINIMLKGQRYSGNEPNIKIFMNEPFAGRYYGGFDFLDYRMSHPYELDPFMIAKKIENYKSINNIV